MPSRIGDPGAPGRTALPRTGRKGRVDSVGGVMERGFQFVNGFAGGVGDRGWIVIYPQRS